MSNFWSNKTVSPPLKPISAPQPTQINKVAQYQLEAKRLQDEANKANSFWGLTKATVLGIPKALKETLLPTRGFSEGELFKAQPTFKEKAKAIPQLGAEIFWGLGELGAKGIDAITSKNGNRLIDKIAMTKTGGALADFQQKVGEFAIPKTAGEAKAMRIFDVASNFIPVGGALKNTAKSAKIIAGTKDIAIVSKELKAIGIADNMVEKMSSPLAKITDTKRVESIIESVLEKQKRFPKTAPEPTIVPKVGNTITVYRAAPKFPDGNFEKGTYFGVSENNARWNAESHYKGEPQDITVRKYTIPESKLLKEGNNYRLNTEYPAKIIKETPKVEQSPLLKEAQKYKSAEEFVKAQPTVYRGEGGSNVAQGKALLAEGKHFASDAEYPKGFGKVGEYVLKPNAKVLDLGDSTFTEISQKLGIPERSYISPKELSTIAKEKGYDVVKYTGEYKSTGKQFSHTVDLTGDSYITKSQLTDIWNQSKGITPKGEQTYKIIKQEGIKEVKGTPVKIVDGVDTFIHEGTGGWVVSEASTGRFLADSASKEGAIAKAKFNIENVGEVKFKQLLLDKQILSSKTNLASQTPPPLAKKVLPEKAGVLKPPLQPKQKFLKSETLDKAYTPEARKSRFTKIKDNIIEYVQNKEQTVKKLVERKDVKITDVSDPYLKSTLYSGRVADKISIAKKESQTIVNEMGVLSKELKTDLKSVHKEVNDFLISRHAPERNLALGDNASGMTTIEASQRLKAIKESPQGAKIEKIADKIQELNNKTLDTLKEGGVITDELYNTLRTKYKNHVPLNRVMEETEDMGSALSGRGFDVRSTGIKKAVGSEREVSDILGNVIHNYEQAVLRSEKNIVDNATLAFVRENQKTLGDLLTIEKPQMIGKDFKGNPLLSTTNDPQTLQMFENGKRIWIKIKDPQLAVALRGIGKEKLGGILQAVGTFTRLYSGLATRFNPEFAIPNKIRDLQETLVYLSSRKEIGAKGAFKTVAKDPQSIKDVIASLSGKDTPGAKLYAEMKATGGTTGGFGLSTKAKVELDIKKMETLANSKTKRIADNLVEYVDNWNTIFEDSTRLSVYKQALKQGLSKERAAFLSKEATINFNRMGKGGPVINALYMFSNASIQGSAKMIRAMKNPKVAAGVSIIVGGAVATTSEWNDKVDPEWRDKVPKWDRLNGLPVLIPSTDDKFRYITIPVSWGIKPIKVMADYAYDMTSGHKYSAKEVTEGVMTAILESYNPAGGTDITSALAPTIIDVPLEISRNKSWTGKSIKPDWDKNAPEDIKYFESLKDTGTGRTAISITEFLQKNTGAGISPADMKYAFDSYIGGAGRFVTKTLNIGSSIFKKKELPIDEYPFVSRFYRESKADEVQGKGTEDVKSLLENQSRERFDIKQEAISLDEELQKLSPEQARAKWEEVNTQNPELASKLSDVVEERKLGLTYEEKLMKQLGVENGERAKYIDEQIMKLPKEQRREYYEELVRKKVISENVAEQINKLKQL